MHLNTKKIAFAGVMLALTEVGIALGSVIETNTLFLLAAASFFVGIVIQEFGLKSGAGFLLAGIFFGVRADVPLVPAFRCRVFAGLRRFVI